MRFAKWKKVADLRKSLAAWTPKQLIAEKVATEKWSPNTWSGQITLLDWVIEKGTPADLKAILHLGADPEARAPNDPGPPIFGCVGAPKKLTAILNAGGDVNRPDHTARGATFLMDCLDYISDDEDKSLAIQCVKIALKHGANPHAVDDNGVSAFDLAAAQGLDSQFDSLVKKHASVEANKDAFPIRRCFGHAEIRGKLSKANTDFGHEMLGAIGTSNEKLFEVRISGTISLVAAVVVLTGGTRTLGNSLAGLQSIPAMIVSPAIVAKELEGLRTKRSLENRIRKEGAAAPSGWVAQLWRYAERQLAKRKMPGEFNTTNSDDADDLVGRPALLLGGPNFDPALLIANMKLFGTSGQPGALVLSRIYGSSIATALGARIVRFGSHRIVIALKRRPETIDELKQWAKMILHCEDQIAYTLDELRSENEGAAFNEFLTQAAMTKTLVLNWD